MEQALIDVIAETSESTSPVLADPMTDEELKAVETMARQGHAADVAIMDSYEVVEAAGQIKALDFTKHVSEIAMAQAASRIRASKKYKGLPYKGPDGNPKHVSDFDEFCAVFLGRSGRRVQQLMQNLHTLGAELYEASLQIGFRARDYATLKALPAEDQEIVKQALEAEDKGQVLDILQELAARAAAQKEADAKALAEAQADLEAKDALLAEKTKRNDKLATELEKLKRLPGDKSLELRLAREKDAVASIDTTMVKVLGAIAEHLQGLETVLEADVSLHTREYACNSARMLCEHIADLLAKHGIAVDLQEIVRPEWTRDVAKTQLTGGEG